MPLSPVKSRLVGVGLRFIDEPTAGLDPEERMRFKNLIYSLNKNKDKGIIISTHIVDDVVGNCDSVIVLKDGAVLYMGSEQQITQMADGKVFYLPDHKENSGDLYIEKNVKIGGKEYLRVLAKETPEGADTAEPTLEDGYLCLIKQILDGGEHMKLFAAKCKLEYKNMRYLFWLPIAVVCVVIPVSMWMSLISSWGQTSEQVLGKILRTIEVAVPILSLVWTLAVVGKYFDTATAPVMLMYSTGKSCLPQIFVNILLYALLLTAPYAVLYGACRIPELVIGEWFKTFSQAVFFNGMAYGISFLLRDGMWGFAACITYYMTFMFFDKEDLLKDINIFAGTSLLINEYHVYQMALKALIAGGVLLAAGYAANRYYTRKKGR